MADGEETAMLDELSSELGFEIAYTVGHIGFSGSHHVVARQGVRAGKLYAGTGGEDRGILVFVLGVKATLVPLVRTTIIGHDHAASNDGPLMFDQQEMSYALSEGFYEEVFGPERRFHFGAVELCEDLIPFADVVLVAGFAHYGCGLFQLAATVVTQVVCRGIDMKIEVLAIGKAGLLEGLAPRRVVVEVAGFDIYW